MKVHQWVPWEYTVHDRQTGREVTFNVHLKVIGRRNIPPSQSGAVFISNARKAVVEYRRRQDEIDQMLDEVAEDRLRKAE